MSAQLTDIFQLTEPIGLDSMPRLASSDLGTLCDQINQVFRLCNLLGPKERLDTA